jgi:hypothetical protein
MRIGRFQRHSQPSNDPNVGLRRRDLRDGRQRGSARDQMQESAAGKFHVALLALSRAKLRFVRGAGVRIYLDQIRPHGPERSFDRAESPSVLAWRHTGLPKP